MTRDRAPDHAFSVVTLVLLSMPDFLLATILLLAFCALGRRLRPCRWSMRHPALPNTCVTTLPAVTLAIVIAVYAVRMLRDNLIEVLDSDYVRMAELKGLSRARVLLRHALPNAVVPTLNVTALNLAYLVGGVVVVESLLLSGSSAPCLSIPCNCAISRSLKPP